MQESLYVLLINYLYTAILFVEISRIRKFRFFESFSDHLVFPLIRKMISCDTPSLQSLYPALEDVFAFIANYSMNSFIFARERRKVKEKKERRVLKALDEERRKEEKREQPCVGVKSLLQLPGLSKLIRC